VTDMGQLWDERRDAAAVFAVYFAERAKKGLPMTMTDTAETLLKHFIKKDTDFEAAIVALKEIK